MNEVAVLAGQPHRIPPRLVDKGDDVLIDQPPQHHLHHIQRFIIGDPHALDELALLADPLQQLTDLRSTAVNHHRIHPDQFEQHHIARKFFLKRDFRHGISPVLDHDGLAMKTLDVGQRLDQNGTFQIGRDGQFSHGNAPEQWRPFYLRTWPAEISPRALPLNELS